VQPEELLPIKYGYQDWDTPDGAIDYPRLSKFLKHVKDMGSIPDDHRSHDYLNKQTDLLIGAECQHRLAERFRVIQDQVKENGHINIVWGLVDGFLLYWNQVRQHRCLNRMRKQCDSALGNHGATRYALLSPCSTQDIGRPEESAAGLHHSKYVLPHFRSIFVLIPLR
jgi:hypothetical protein